MHICVRACVRALRVQMLGPGRGVIAGCMLPDLSTDISNGAVCWLRSVLAEVGVGAEIGSSRAMLALSY